MVEQVDALQLREEAPRPIRHTIFIANSYNASTRTYGIGLVVRAGNKPTRNGPIISRQGQTHENIQSADVQVFAILRALELANCMGWRNIRVKSDYPHRDRLKRHSRNRTGGDADGLVGAILRLAYTLDEVHFRHVARRKNLEARKLARKAAGNEERRQKSGTDHVPWWEIGIETEMPAHERDEFDDVIAETAATEFDALPF